MAMNELELWKKLDRVASAMETIVLQLSDVLLYLQYPIIKKETTDEDTKHLRPDTAESKDTGGKVNNQLSYEDNPTAKDDKRTGDGGSGSKKK